MFPDLIWTIPSTDKVLYLTFDDGPTPQITEWVLDILRHYRASATFFCVGKQVELHPQIYQQIIEEGHGIGNHTQNHIKGWKSSTSEYIKEVSMASKFIDSKLFRPPYGQITPKQVTALTSKGFEIVMWNILSMDWEAKVSRQECTENVLHKASDGDIIVFHDSLKAADNMKYALAKVLDKFSEDGYDFRRIPVSGR